MERYKSDFQIHIDPEKKQPTERAVAKTTICAFFGKFREKHVKKQHVKCWSVTPLLLVVETNHREATYSE